MPRSSWRTVSRTSPVSALASATTSGNSPTKGTAFARTVLARGHAHSEAHRLAEVIVRVLGCPATAYDMVSRLAPVAVLIDNLTAVARGVATA